MEQKSQTMKTIERLRGLADELEALADDFPNLSWYKAWQERLWNSDRATMHQTGCFYKVMVDEENVARATRVRVGNKHATAVVALENLSSGIPVLYIDGLGLCTLPHARDEVCEVVAMLPEHLRLPIYKRIAQIRKDSRKAKQEKLQELRRQLRELE